MPKVSVVLSVHNGERYLAQALDSVLTQNFTDCEYLLIDDASTDTTPAILENYAKQDDRIRVLTNPVNLGLTRSLNIGLRAAQGDYIARQDADDISLAGRFAEQVAYLDSHPETVLVSGEMQRIDAEGRILDRSYRAAPSDLIRWYMLFYNHVAGHSQVMFRRQAALQVGIYDESLRYSQDYALWSRLLTVGEIAILPQVWLQWRTHGDNISTQRFAEQEAYSLRESQRALTEGLGVDVSLETLAAIRAFWLEPFPAAQQARNINHILREIYKTFVQKYPDAHIAERVAERYWRWARSVSIRQHPAVKLSLWRYSLGWQIRRFSF